MQPLDSLRLIRFRLPFQVDPGKSCDPGPAGAIRAGLGSHKRG